MGTSLAENELHGNIVKEIKYNSFREFYIENFLSDDSDNRRCPYFKWKNGSVKILSQIHFIRQ